MTPAKEMIKNQEMTKILHLAKESFMTIAPFWPLKNLIGVNPLQGFENMPIESALEIGAVYFQQSELPEPMQAIIGH